MSRSRSSAGRPHLRIDHRGVGDVMCATGEVARPIGLRGGRRRHGPVVRDDRRAAPAGSRDRSPELARATSRPRSDPAGPASGRRAGAEPMDGQIADEIVGMHLGRGLSDEGSYLLAVILPRPVGDPRRLIYLRSPGGLVPKCRSRATASDAPGSCARSHAVYGTRTAARTGSHASSQRSRSGTQVHVHGSSLRNTSLVYG